MQRRRLTLRWAGAALVVVAVAGAAVAWPRTDTHVTIRAGAHATGIPAADGPRLPLIRPGETKPMFLSDGTPVWEVRNHDGSVAVLAADSALADPNFPVSGLRVLTFWVRAERRFYGSGVYDDHGRILGFAAPFVGGNPPLPTDGADLARYDAAVVGSSVVIGAIHPGAARHFDPHAAVGGGQGGYEMAQIESFDNQPVASPLLSLAQAVAETAGTMSAIDAVVIVDRNGPPRLCSLGRRLDHFPFPPCPPSAPVPVGLSARPVANGVEAVGGGPLFVRVRGGVFYDVILSGAGNAGYLINGTEPAPQP